MFDLPEGGLESPIVKSNHHYQNLDDISQTLEEIEAMDGIESD
jgi:hypothetical protein